MTLWALEKKRQFSPFLWNGTSSDPGTAREFIDPFSGRLDWTVGQRGAAVPQKETPINRFL
jgi:hypothetical protein